jgi:hypothetical protein
MQWVIDTRRIYETGDTYSKLTVTDENAALGCHSRMKRGLCKSAADNNEITGTLLQ